MNCPHCGGPLLFCDICDMKTYCEICDRCHDIDDLDIGMDDAEFAERGYRYPRIIKEK